MCFKGDNGFLLFNVENLIGPRTAITCGDHAFMYFKATLMCLLALHVLLDIFEPLF